MSNTTRTLTWVDGKAEGADGHYILQREDPFGEGVWHEAWFCAAGGSTTVYGSGSYGRGSAARARTAALQHHRARLDRTTRKDTPAAS